MCFMKTALKSVHIFSGYWISLHRADDNYLLCGVRCCVFENVSCWCLFIWIWKFQIKVDVFYALVFFNFFSTLVYTYDKRIANMGGEFPGYTPQARIKRRDAIRMSQGKPSHCRRNAQCSQIQQYPACLWRCVPATKRISTHTANKGVSARQNDETSVVLGGPEGDRPLLQEQGHDVGISRRDAADETLGRAQ